MTEWKIYPITYMGLDPNQWIRKQLITKYWNKKNVSVFLDLRKPYRRKRDYSKDLEQCKAKPQYDKIVEFKKS